nr:MAG TPA: hypothetical protein [Caudoviricetes sp.]
MAHASVQTFLLFYAFICQRQRLRPSQPES